MDSLKNVNPNYYEDGCLALELCNSLYPRYVKADLHEKAKIANLVASNYTLIDANLVPKRRRPFSIFAERPSSTRWLHQLHGLSNYFMSDEPAILNTLIETTSVLELKKSLGF